MAQQIKKKYIENDAIDGLKLKLLKNQVIRTESQSGQEVDLIKLGLLDQVLVKGQEIAYKSELESEIAARILGDDNLSISIDYKINEEAALRIVGDADLQEKLDLEKQSRIAGDADLKTKLDFEVLQRQNYDAQILVDAKDYSDLEKTRALAAEGLLSGRIDGITEVSQAYTDLETTRALAAELVLRTDLSDEITERQIAVALTETHILEERDLRIAADITTLANSKTYTDSAIAGVIATAPEVLNTLKELADALAADPNFATTITTQIAGVQTSVNNEVTRAIAREDFIESEVFTENSRAVDAELLLSGRIDAEESLRISRDEEITSLVAQEEQRAMAKEALLESEDISLFSGIQTVASDLVLETQDRVAADLAIRAELDSFRPDLYSKVLTESDVLAGYFTFTPSATLVPGSIVAFSGRVFMLEGDDFLASQEGSLIKILFAGSFALNELEAASVGDRIVIKYWKIVKP